MSRIIFEELSIFSPGEQLAKHIEFEDGLNIVTSSQVDGTDRGKSVIVKSLYHALGADCYFDKRWDDESKVYLLKFNHQDQPYSICRIGNTFKLFDSSLNLIWTTSHRHELGTLFEDMFGFATYMQNRNQETVIAPPAYSFLIYFLDQNHYECSTFASFKGLSAYKDYKESVIYSHAGVYNADYFELKKKKEHYQTAINSSNAGLEKLNGMMDSVDEELLGCGYSIDMETLAFDISKIESEYGVLSASLNKKRAELAKLRLEREETENAIGLLTKHVRGISRGFAKLNQKTCPVCSSKLNDTIEARIIECSTHEDGLIMLCQLRMDREKLDSAIAKTSELYQSDLSKMNHLKRRIEPLEKTRKNALQIEGLNQIRARFSGERQHLARLLEIDKEAMKTIEKELKRFSDSKKAVNERFVELIAEGVRRFGLKEIALDKVKGVGSTLEAGGSNKPIVTIVWLFALLTIEAEFNSSAVSMPIVLDSPLNVETDDEKKKGQYDFIFGKCTQGVQMIVAALGFDEPQNGVREANIIRICNEKYQLLNHEDYLRHKHILFSCLEAE